MKSGCNSRILIADDEPWYAQGVIEGLKEAGYKVEVVSESGSAVLDELEADTSYDLIILDIMMPPGDRIDAPNQGRTTGVEVLEYIRLEMNLRTPVIFLTVIMDRAVHNRIQQIESEAGLEATILVKPVSPLDVLDTVNRICGTKAAKYDLRNSVL